VDIERNDEGYVAKDKGVDYFNENFTHTVDVKNINCSGTSGKYGCWVVADELLNSEYEYDLSGSASALFLWCGYDPMMWQIRNWVEGDLESWGAISGTYSYGTQYYLTIKRYGLTVEVKIYDKDRRHESDLVGSGSLEQNEAYGYQYIGVFGAEYAGVPTTSAIVSNLDVPIELVLTFYFNDGGIFRVDNATISNGTEKIYLNETYIELASLPQNSTYVFSIFSWNSSNSTTNPYNLTIHSNLTVWCYFAVSEGGYAGYGFLFFGLIAGLVVGVLVGFGSKH